MSIFEYDQEAHMRLIRREGYEEGMTDGIAQDTAESILELLEDVGGLTEELRITILTEKRINQKKGYFKEFLEISLNYPFITISISTKPCLA